ncbi:MAG: hypothetical protein ACK5XS_05655 [Armatimonadota bacterium]|nr:hypothetical protein [Fimbriimonadaceae bacterium]
MADPSPPEVNPEVQSSDPGLRRFAWILAGIFGGLAVLPAFAAITGAAPGTLSLGTAIAVDDQMVYAAWMRQAAEGRFLFENRFTLDAQPGLTFHLYFLVMGWMAKLVGFPWAMLLSRLVFSALFVFGLVRLQERLGWKPAAIKTASVMACFGAGVGWMVWQNFGLLIKDPGVALQSIFAGRLPIDVWQTEAFAFPSALANGLFMASLWLIVVVFAAVLDARTDGKAVWRGALAFGVLANIHSYDALLVGLVLLAFAAVQYARHTLEKTWLLRCVGIAAGAIPAAAWLGYVLQQDAVFQARAATLTYAPHFTSVFWGVAALVVIAVWGYFRPEPEHRWRPTIVVGALVVILLTLSRTHSPEGYFLNPVSFGIVLVGIGAGLIYSRQDRDDDMIWAWALVGLVAMYFPALFQRKLGMGMVIPWGLLAGYALTARLASRDVQRRQLITLVLVLFCGVSSLFWLRRELTLTRDNVSSTTVHPVRLSASATEILAKVQTLPARSIVVAAPGIPMPLPTGEYAEPYLPDLNPFFVGLGGARSFAGHWSETPDYGNRRNNLAAFILSGGTQGAEAIAQAAQGEPVFVVLPRQETFPQVRMNEFSLPSELILETQQYRLVRWNPPAP